MRQRGKRHDPGRTVLTDRDLELLAYIGRSQPVTSAEIGVRASLSLPMSRRRLRVMVDHGLLSVFVRAQEEPNVYTLAPAGRRLLAEASGTHDSAFVCLRGIGRGPLLHHLMVARLYAATLRANELGSKWQLARFRFEAELRLELGDKKGTTIPDATAVFTHADGRRAAFAVESDTGSEKSATWVAEHKSIPYAQALETSRTLESCSCWGVVFVVRDERRRQRLLQAFAQTIGTSALIFIARAEDLTGETLWTPFQTWQRSAPGESVNIHRHPPEAVTTTRDDRRHGSAPEDASNAAHFDNTPSANQAALRNARARAELRNASNAPEINDPALQNTPRTR